MAEGGGDDLLSARLACLAAWLREYEHDGMQLEPLAVQSIAAAVSQFALDAGALERLVVPGRARVDPAAFPEGVVPLHPDGAA